MRRTLAAEVEEPLTPDLCENLRDLAEQRAELLDKAIATTGAYVRALGDLDHASGQRLKTVAGYDDYLAERLLWVRNAPPIGPATWEVLPTAIAWFFSPTNWLQVRQVLIHAAAGSPLGVVVDSGGAVALVAVAGYAQGILATAGGRHRSHIGLLLRAFGVALLLATFWSILPAILGWSLHTSLEATPFTKAVGHGALSMAFGLFSLRAFRLLYIPGGVADRYFGWPSRALQIIRRNFDWVIWLLIPVGFVVDTVHSYRNPLYAKSLGRIALLIVTVGFAFFVGRLAYPQREVPSVPISPLTPGGGSTACACCGYGTRCSWPRPWCSRYSPCSAMSIRPEHSCGP